MCWVRSLAHSGARRHDEAGGPGGGAGHGRPRDGGERAPSTSMTSSGARRLYTFALPGYCSHRFSVSSDRARGAGSPESCPAVPSVVWWCARGCMQPRCIETARAARGRGAPSVAEPARTCPRSPRPAAARGCLVSQFKLFGGGLPGVRVLFIDPAAARSQTDVNPSVALVSPGARGRRRPERRPAVVSLERRSRPPESGVRSRRRGGEGNPIRLPATRCIYVKHQTN